MRAVDRRSIFTLLALILASSPGALADQGTISPRNLVAVEHRRQTIYHSPQTPGYTCWTGIWTMPDASIMVCFTRATGPVEGRPRCAEETLEKLDWPPGQDPHYDMTGLDLRNVHLRSSDGGQTWVEVS